MVELNYPHPGVRLFPNHPHDAKFVPYYIQEFAYKFRLIHTNIQTNHIPRAASVTYVEAYQKPKVVIDFDSGWDEPDLSPMPTIVSNLQGIPIRQRKA